MVEYDLMPVLEAATRLIVVIVGLLIIPYLKNKMGAEKFDNMYSIIATLAQAAEQIYANMPKSTERSLKKKEFVYSRLEEMNIKIDPALLDDILESAVLSINNSAKDKQQEAA